MYLYHMRKSILFVDIKIIFLLFFLLGPTVFSGCAKSLHPGKNLTAEQELAKFNELFEAGEPFYTLDEAKDIVYDLVPKIEKLAGKKFLSIPEIRLIDSAEAAMILKQKNTSFLNRSKNQFENSFNKKEETIIQLMSKTMGGIYEPGHKRLNLIPTNIEPKLRIMDLGYKHGMLIAKMTIAHELTHALQDQHIDLEQKMGKVPGADEWYALASTIEGHAEFIKRSVGRLLGVRYYESDEQTDLDFKNPLIKNVVSSESPYILKYTKGRQFIEYHFEKGGNRLLWQILENPPVDTSMIIHPETYRPLPYDTLNYRAILDNVYDFAKIDKTTQNIKFDYHNFSISKFSVRYLFSDLKIPDKNDIISKIEHYQNLSVKYKAITFARIGFAVLESEKDTLQYIEIEKKFLSQKVKAAFSDMHNNFLCKNDSIKIAEQITTFEKIKTRYEQEKLVKTKYAIMAKNNMVVIYRDVALWLDSCEILKIAEKIFTRYESAENTIVPP